MLKKDCLYVAFVMVTVYVTCTVYCAFQQKEVKDVFAAIVFEADYSLGKHVVDGHQDRDLPSLIPVLRWKKGEKIAAKNEV